MGAEPAERKAEPLDADCNNDEEELLSKLLQHLGRWLYCMYVFMYSQMCGCMNVEVCVHDTVTSVSMIETRTIYRDISVCCCCCCCCCCCLVLFILHVCILYYIVAMFWSFLCNCVQNHPKLRVVDPLDYEGQLITRCKNLDHEKYLNLFPQQDVKVGVVMWFYTSLPPFLMISVRELIEGCYIMSSVRFLHVLTNIVFTCHLSTFLETSY